MFLGRPVFHDQPGDDGHATHGGYFTNDSFGIRINAFYITYRLWSDFQLNVFLHDFAGFSPLFSGT
jgi:hypothetical protein